MGLGGIGVRLIDDAVDLPKALILFTVELLITHRLPSCTASYHPCGDGDRDNRYAFRYQTENRISKVKTMSAQARDLSLYGQGGDLQAAHHFW